MEIELIRHFATEGNLEKRYIGVRSGAYSEKRRKWT